MFNFIKVILEICVTFPFLLVDKVINNIWLLIGTAIILLLINIKKPNLIKTITTIVLILSGYFMIQGNANIRHEGDLFSYYVEDFFYYEYIICGLIFSIAMLVLFYQLIYTIEKKENKKVK